MPSPSSALATQRPDLAESFTEFDLEMDRRGFISGEVFPVAEVASQAGNFGRIPLEQLLANRETKRAPGSGYARSDWTFDPEVYACVEHGAEEPVDDRESAMYAQYFDAEQVAASRALDVVLRNAESRVASVLFDNWTGTSQPVTTAWSDKATSVPRDDVSAAQVAVWNAIGIWPNALIINRLVFNDLIDNNSIIERLKYAGIQDPDPGAITRAAMAQALGVDMLMVAGSPKNTAAEGQSRSLAPLWSNSYAQVCLVATTNDFREPCIGRTFHWGEDGSSIGGTFETYRDESVRADIVRARHDVDEKLLYQEAGIRLTGVKV